MQRLLIDTGGRPIKNEDYLEYLQIITLFESWFLDIQLGDCIVYGCVISGGGPYNVSAGVIYYNGELRIFDAVVGVALPMLLEAEDVDINSREYEDGAPKYTAQIFKMVQDGGGAFSFDADTPRTKEALLGPGATKKKYIDIGDWDMNVSVAGSLSVSLAHGFGDHTKIKKIRVRIFADDDSGRANIIYDYTGAGDNTGVGGGGIAWDAANIILTIIAASFFDHADFNKLAFNRGDIEITYID